MIAPIRILPQTDFHGAQEALRDWLEARGLWWAASTVAHALALSIVMLVAGLASLRPARPLPAAGFEAASVDTSLPLDLDSLSLDAASLEMAAASSETPAVDALESVVAMSSIADAPDETPLPGETLAPATASGDGGLLDARSLLDGARSASGRGPAGGPSRGESGANAGGQGGSGHGFSQRGEFGRNMPGSGATGLTRHAVAAALDWLVRHQNQDGSWDLAGYKSHCRDATCSGPGSFRSTSGATSLGLLPFLAGGQTHRNRGPYQRQIQAGIYWLLRRQRENGDLSAGANQPLYAHALATIALSEAYGLSGDRECGAAAQMAVHYIEQSQNPADGGWRYQPREPGDTSVVGWQVMALKSAQMAGLSVGESTLTGAQRWLDAVGGSDGRYCYQRGHAKTPAMSAVGLLCAEYLGTPRDNPALGRGVNFLLANRPNLDRRDTYYWYYATQVLHNWNGPDWDQWNRTTRRILVETQQTNGCAAGSWDPTTPERDAWGPQGGRLMVTTLSCLTLEVYYRYLPLYKLNEGNRAAE